MRTAGTVLRLLAELLRDIWSKDAVSNGKDNGAVAAPLSESFAHGGSEKPDIKSQPIVWLATFFQSSERRQRKIKNTACLWAGVIVNYITT